MAYTNKMTTHAEVQALCRNVIAGGICPFTRLLIRSSAYIFQSFELRLHSHSQDSGTGCVDGEGPVAKQQHHSHGGAVRIREFALSASQAVLLYLNTAW